MIDRAPHDSSNLPVASQPNALPYAFQAGQFGGARGAPAPDDSESVPWTRYLDALRRNWWVIAIVSVLGSGAGLYMARGRSLIYSAEAKIWINPNASAQQGGVVGQRQLLGSSSWVELMKSNPVVAPVVLKLGLNAAFAKEDSAFTGSISFDPEFKTGRYQVNVDAAGSGYALMRLSDSSIVERGRLGDSIGRGLGFRWAPPARMFATNRVVELGVGPPLLAAQSLMGSLRDRLEQENGQFLLLAFERTDPRHAAVILNEWITQFVSAAAEMKNRQLVLFKADLQQQVELVGRQLATAEQQLQDFQERNIALPGAEVLAPMQGGGRAGAAMAAGPQATYQQMTLDADALKTTRVALQKIVDDARGGPLNREALFRVPAAVTESPDLQNAISSLDSARLTLNAERKIYTDSATKIIDLRARIASLERDTIPRLVQGIIANHRDLEARVSSQVQSQYRELRQIPERTIRQSRLQRQVNSTQELWNRLSSRYEEAKLAEAQTTPDLTILQPAEVPLFPSSNPGPRLFFLAIMASLAAAVGLALLRDKMDRRFRYPEQATNELGLLIAGTVPRFRLNRRRQMSVTAMSQVVESFRTLRLAVRHHFPVEQPVVLCVSSPGAGDGKSIVSSNLAVAFANAGHKTLLIDGDVRRGVVHDTFDIARRPGLVDYLAGTASAAAVVRTSSTENLSVIPAGSRSRRAPELLVSDRMSALVSAMREQYEVVIIDSPPFVAGVDAFALAASAGTMLVVLRPGITDRKLAAMKLEVMDRLPVSVIGAVLNGVGTNGAYRYYYSDYSYAAGPEDSPSGLDELGEPLDSPSPPRLRPSK